MKTFAVICISVVAASVLAQETRPVGLSIRAGQFRPQGQAAREEDKTWIAGGIDFRLKDLKFNGPESRSLTISVDYASKGDFATTPVCVNYVLRRKEWYYFGGAGVAFSTVPKTVGSDTEKEDSIELAYQVGFGYDFSSGKSPLFAEAKYMGNGEDKLSAFAIMIGVRL